MTDKDTEPLMALERRRTEAIAAGDLEALAEVLADDYLHVLAPGRVCTKAQYIEMIRRSPRAPRRGALRVRLYGAAAIVDGELENHLGAPGQIAQVVPAYCTQVAAYREGRWRFVSYILTRKRALVGT